MSEGIYLGAGEAVPGSHPSNGASSPAADTNPELAQFQAIIRAKWREYEKALVRHEEMSPEQARALCKTSADAACAELRQTMTSGAATRDLTTHEPANEPSYGGRSL